VLGMEGTRVQTVVYLVVLCESQIILYFSSQHTFQNLLQTLLSFIEPSLTFSIDKTLSLLGPPATVRPTTLNTRFQAQRRANSPPTPVETQAFFISDAAAARDHARVFRQTRRTLARHIPPARLVQPVQPIPLTSRVLRTHATLLAHGVNHPVDQYTRSI
jgi:hypothetical protein